MDRIKLPPRGVTYEVSNVYPLRLYLYRNSAATIFIS